MPTTILGFIASGSQNYALFFMSIIIIILVDLSANVINNYSDWDIDIKNHKREKMHEIFKKWHMLILYIVILMFIIITLISLGASNYLWITILISILLGILYSLEPKLKDITILNYATIAVAYAGAAFSVGYFTGSSNLYIFTKWIPLILFLMLVDFGYSITKDYADILGDAFHGKKTLPVVIGRKRSVKVQAFEITIAYIFLLAAIFTGLLHFAFIILLVSYLIAMYILLHINYTENKKIHETMHYYAQRNGLLVRFLIIMILLL